MLSMLILIALTSMLPTVKWAFLIIATLGFYWQWRKLSVLPVALIQKDFEEWLLQTQDGQMIRASLMNDCYVTSWLVILHFRVSSGGRQSVVILPFMTGQDAFRQLVVYLRLVKPETLTNE
jgi:hypothetical protein